MSPSNTLSKEEVREILRKKLKKDFTLESYHLEPLEEKQGHMGEYSILKVSLKNKNFPKTLQFFCKFHPSSECGVFCRETRSFKKELFVYGLFEKMAQEKVFNHFATISHCYFSKADEVLVFDDLKLQGFDTLKRTAVLDYNSTLILLGCLADLHASTLIYEEKLSGKNGKRYRLLDDYAEILQDTLYLDREDFINKKGLEASVKCLFAEIDEFGFPEVLGNGRNFKEVVERNVCGKIFEAVASSKKYRNVLCHGDLWTTNLLWKYKEGKPLDCKFVDFQCVRYLPPAYDVVGCLYLNTTREFRKKHFYEVLGIYYKFLEGRMKVAGYVLSSLISFEDFLESCEEAKLYANYQTSTYFPMILADSKVVHHFLEVKELYKKVFEEDKGVLFLHCVNQDEAYRFRCKESIEDLYDYCNALYWKKY